jgi:hypothetical protein
MKRADKMHVVSQRDAIRNAEYYCPHTGRKSLIGMRYTRMRKFSRQVTSCY